MVHRLVRRFLHPLLHHTDKWLGRNRGSALVLFEWRKEQGAWGRRRRSYGGRHVSRWVSSYKARSFTSTINMIIGTVVRNNVGPTRRATLVFIVLDESKFGRHYAWHENGGRYRRGEGHRYQGSNSERLTVGYPDEATRRYRQGGCH